MEKYIKRIVVLILLTIFNNSHGVEKEFLGIHFVARGVKLEDAIKIVDLANASKYTHVIIQLADGIEFEAFPGALRADAMSRDDFKLLLLHIKKSGLEFIPEIKLLTHQEKFFQNVGKPFLYNETTYDPKSQGIYPIIYSYLSEVIEVSNPSMIHIGHDELAGLDRRFRKNRMKLWEKTLPSELFLKDVLTIHKYLTERGIKVGMWGDMLISPKEDKVNGLKNAHGKPKGYGPELRKKIPNDITIFDWHYKLKQKDVGSVDLFMEDGFDVVASVWENQTSAKYFIDYVTSRDSGSVLVTLWYYVQKGDWVKVQDIISSNSEIYHKALDN